MAVAVMTDLVPRLGDTLYQLRKGVDGVARDEPRCQHLMAPEHVEQPLSAHLAELATGDRAG